MAKKTEEKPDDFSENVRSGIKSMLRGLLILIPVAILAYLLYMIFVGSSPRQQLRTPEETLVAYNRTVSPFVGPTGGRPNAAIRDEFLDYFDKDSREFFKDNAFAMAQSRLQFEPGTFQQLNNEARLNEAMLFLVNRAPLSGFAPPRESRQTEDGRTEVVVRARDGRDHRLLLSKSGDTWYITDLGGLRAQLTQELERFQPARDKR